MRIGILTFHCAHNYGAVLQCYALQEFLKGRGHDVSVIDYRPMAVTKGYRWLNRKKLIRKNFILAIKELLLLPFRKIRYDKFNKFVEKNIQLCLVSDIEKEPFDLIVVGSDQVWNYKITNGFDPFYWGAFKCPTDTCLASYGASMQDNWQNELSVKIRNQLEHFDYLSVRESSLASKLEVLLKGKKVYKVVDPTLLLEREAWGALAKKPKMKKPYLLLFQVEKRNKKTESIAKKLSERLNLPIVRFMTLVDWNTSRKAMTTSPEEFVGWFMNASFVVCSSFHGTVFSLIFNKPFVSVRMGVGKDNRVDDLLQALNLENHFVDMVDEEDDYNYHIENERLSLLRGESIKFIEILER